MGQKRTLIIVLILIVSPLCHGAALVELAASHRLIAVKAVETGTRVTLQLHLLNRSPYNYKDITLSPVDPAFLITPNETTVSIDRLDSGQQAVVPWKVTLPYAVDKFHGDMPIALQGSTTDGLGNIHNIHIFSHRESDQ